MKQGGKKFLIMVLVFFVMGFGLFSWSQQLQRQQVAKTKIPKLELPVDPYIFVVCANNKYCSQSLSGVNALLLQHITVVVGNRACAHEKGNTASGKVTVSFFSYRHGRMLSKTVPFAVKAFREQKIVVFSGLYLIKKSIGVTAVITKINAPLKDCDTSNNSQTQRKWMSCAVVK